MKRTMGFTLIEILVVVVLLGILAAVVIPAVANSVMPAKEASLAADLQILNRFILVYKAHHLEVAPGYDTSGVPNSTAFEEQATMASNTHGETAAVGTADYNRGPYLQKIPVNPINGKATIEMLGDGDEGIFPENGDDSHGWIYKAATGQIRPDCRDSDTSEKRYYDY